MSQAKPRREKPSPQIRSMQAHRLAAADFYYGMNPDRTAVVCNLTPSEANSLRKSKSYVEQMEGLRREMDSTLKKDLKVENDRIKQRMADLVPKAIERLHDQLDDVGLVGLQAAREILDRDGRMPKVSRVQSTIEDTRGIPDVDDRILAEFQARPVN